MKQTLGQAGLGFFQALFLYSAADQAAQIKQNPGLAQPRFVFLGLLVIITSSK